MSASRKDASVSKKGGYATLNIQYKSRADGGKHHGQCEGGGREASCGGIAAVLLGAQLAACRSVGQS